MEGAFPWRQAGYTCFQSLSVSLSQLVLISARGRIAVVFCSMQRVTALLIPVIRINLWPILMLE